MTPEELETWRAEFDNTTCTYSVLDFMDALIKALREAWQERDRLRTCKHADQFYMTNPPRCMECGWTGDPPWSIARAERIECAKLAEDMDAMNCASICFEIANAIRARGKEGE